MTSDYVPINDTSHDSSPTKPRVPVEGLASYAQHYEDVRIWRAFDYRRHGTYVDVGAGEPERNSVTKLLYDQGWSGINIEPGASFAALAAARPRDVNLNIAVHSDADQVALYSPANAPDLSTIVRENATNARVDTGEISEFVVDAARLDVIIEGHAAGDPVDVLKIDVEGAETEVIASNDWLRFAPLIVVIEAIDPVKLEPSHEGWEPVLLSHGYEFAHFDGINRFYCRQGDTRRRELLAMPVSPADGIARAADVEVARLRGELAACTSELETAKEDHTSLTASNLRLDRELRDVRAQLREAEDDHARQLEAHEHRVREGMDAQFAARIRKLESNHAKKHAAQAQQLAAARARVRQLEESTSFRLGHGIVRTAVAARRWMRAPVTLATRLGRVVVVRPAIHALRRAPRIRTSPRRIQRLYDTISRSDEHLRTVAAPVDVLDPPATDSRVAALWRLLRQRRVSGPRILSADEVRMLADLARSGSGQRAVESMIRPLVDFATANPRSLGAGGGGTRGEPSATTPQGPSTADHERMLIVDVRPLERGRFDGTARHARTIADRLAQRLRPHHEVLLVANEDDAAIDHDLARFGPTIGPSALTERDLARVGAFLQLQPTGSLAVEGAFDRLAQVDDMRRATVWLDAIPGAYPDHFLASPLQFFLYQRLLERLRSYHWVLPLSEAARDEVAPFIAADAECVVTGCLNPLAAYRSTVPQTRQTNPTRVLMTCNSLPHKNVLGGVLAYLHAAARYSPRLELDIVGALTDAQVDAVRRIADRHGRFGDRSVTFHRSIDDSELALLYARAAAVIVPSFHEGFSLPVLEAQEFGRPVVASDIPAHRELLGADALAPADHPAALGRALLEALRGSVGGQRNDDDVVTQRERRFAVALDGALDDLLRAIDGGNSDG